MSEPNEKVRAAFRQDHFRAMLENVLEASPGDLKWTRTKDRITELALQTALSALAEPAPDWPAIIRSQEYAPGTRVGGRQEWFRQSILARGFGTERPVFVEAEPAAGATVEGAGVETCTAWSKSLNAPCDLKPSEHTSPERHMSKGDVFYTLATPPPQPEPRCIQAECEDLPPHPHHEPRHPDDTQPEPAIHAQMEAAALLPEIQAHYRAEVQQPAPAAPSKIDLSALVPDADEGEVIAGVLATPKPEGGTDAAALPCPYPNTPAHHEALHAEIRRISLLCGSDALAAANAELAKVREELEEAERSRDEWRSMYGELGERHDTQKSRADAAEKERDRLRAERDAEKACREETEKDRDMWKAEAARETQRGDVNWGSANREKARADNAERLAQLNHERAVQWKDRADAAEKRIEET